MTVEFQERYYASGKIKGSRFIKREEDLQTKQL